jgi:hypothetical protein
MNQSRMWLSRASSRAALEGACAYGNEPAADCDLYSGGEAVAAADHAGAYMLEAADRRGGRVWRFRQSGELVAGVPL